MRCGLLVWVVTAITASVAAADERPPAPLRVAPLWPGAGTTPSAAANSSSDIRRVAPLWPGAGTTVDLPRTPDKLPVSRVPADKLAADPPAKTPASQPDDTPTPVAPLWPSNLPPLNPAAAVPGECPPVAACDPVPGRLWWARTGPLLYWLSPAPIPAPLVATGPIGEPGTRILIGDQSLDLGMLTGVFAEGGWWFGCERRVGLALGGFITQRPTASRQVVSDPVTTPQLVRPFFNPRIGASGGQDAFLVAAPGRFTGSVAAEAGARLAGAEMNVLVNLAREPNWSIDFVAGARYLDLDEFLTVTQFTRAEPGNLIPYFGATPGVSSVLITDRFRTRNQFWGGQMGLDYECRREWVFVGGGARVGLGPVHQVTEVTGQTVSPGVAGGPGGILAVGEIPNGNIGRTTASRFAVLADAHGEIGVQLGRRARLGVGYQFLYLNDVVRPGDQVSTVIDPRLVPVATVFGTRIPTAASGVLGTPPLTPFNRGDVIAHGVRFSIMVMY